jgi:hypothetical protein
MEVNMKKRKRYVIGMMASLCVLAVGVILTSTSLAAERSEPSVSLNAGRNGQQITVSVGVESAEAIASIQYTLKYDSSRLNVESAVLQGGYKNMMNAVNTEREGEVVLAAAAVEGVKNETTVMDVIFSVKESGTLSGLSFTLSDVVIGDESGRLILKGGSASVQLSDDVSTDTGGGNTGSVSSGGGSSTKPSDTPAADNSSSETDEVFDDVSGHWAYDFIMDAYQDGLMEGYGNNIFGPDRSITRAQMAVVLWNSAGNPAPDGDSPFTDLERDWYRDAVIWASEQGLVKGVGHGLYNPEGTLTREQLTQILYNRAGSVSGMEVMLTGIYEGQYTDSSSISEWAKKAVYWSVYKEILCGTDTVNIGNSLSPKEPASRAQIAVMLVRTQ